ncbi:adenine phosphoribosyltransferase [Sporolactobacillus sp. THM7-4]|nr:adenine phosphoribosyltransferase [Sporolactobacillus sp. THM7-4]
MDYYHLKVANIERNLPIIRITDSLEIASFVILGDSELVIHAAAELKKKIPEADYLITAEAKGIPLVQELSRLLEMKRYFVARKSVKPYMTDPFVTEVNSITTQKKQILVLEKEESDLIKGKRILIVDDVISTGESIKALESLVMKAGGVIAGKAAILAEGDAAERKDIIYLEKLPIFPVKDSFIHPKQ